jgi:hypothetical protein
LKSRTQMRSDHCPGRRKKERVTISHSEHRGSRSHMINWLQPWL